MITLPAGFDASLFVADLSAVGVVLVTVAAIICAGVVVARILRG